MRPTTGIAALALSATLVGCSDSREGGQPDEAGIADAAPAPIAEGGLDADAAPVEAAPPPIVRPDDLPWTDARSMAEEVLDRCRGQSPLALLAVATDRNHRHRPDLGEGATACAAIFGADSWRARAVAEWAGQLGASRQSYEEARVAFAEQPDDLLAVVVLRREQGQWRFHDIGRFSAEALEHFGERINPRPAAAPASP